MTRFLISLAAAALALASAGCITLNSNGYNRLSAGQKARITRPHQPLESLSANDSIYVVDDSLVLDFLEDKDYAIVHSYLTWCKGKHCVNPAIVVKRLEETGLPFLMIAGDYESILGYRADYPFITIDFDHYGTKNYSKGIERLYRGMGCGDDWGSLYHLFKRGSYAGSAETLDALMKLYQMAHRDE